MNKHLKYLAYVIRHKRFVYQEGRKLGVGRLQLLVHDFQKLLPLEWLPYVETFYGPKLDPVFDKDEQAARDAAFDRAWLHHQKLGGKHHWQYWLLHQDDGGWKALEMPEKYRREMLADWKGAGRAISGKDDTRAFYEKNRLNMQLHPKTRAWVEEQLACTRP